MSHKARFTQSDSLVEIGSKAFLNVVSTMLSCPTVVHLDQTGQLCGVLDPVARGSASECKQMSVIQKYKYSSEKIRAAEREQKGTA